MATEEKKDQPLEGLREVATLESSLLGGAEGERHPFNGPWEFDLRPSWQEVSGRRQ